MTDDKKPNSGHLLGQGEPGHPAVGRGPNAGGEYSRRIITTRPPGGVRPKV